MWKSLMIFSYAYLLITIKSALSQDVTVAVLGALYIKESSPKYAPGFKSTTCFYIQKSSYK